jgi:hypothetical protein
MGRGNPNSRSYAVPTMVSNRTDNREYFGGNSKAGVGRHIGMSQFVNRAIVNGAAGHVAPAFAGPYFPTAGKLKLVKPATDLKGKVIIGQNGNKLYYPINFNNQLSGVGRFRSPFNVDADGVNYLNRLQAAESVATWNFNWPSRPLRSTPNLYRKVPFSYYMVNDTTK